MGLAPGALLELLFTPTLTHLTQHSSHHAHVLILPLWQLGALHFGQSKSCQGCAGALQQLSCAVPCPALSSLGAQPLPASPGLQPGFSERQKSRRRTFTWNKLF